MPTTPWIEHVRVKGYKMRKIVNKIVNETHEKVSVNSGEFYPVANKDLVVRQSNSEIQGNTEEKGNHYASNESGGESILVHRIYPKEDYSLVSIVVQGNVVRDSVPSEHAAAKL